MSIEKEYLITREGFTRRTITAEVLSPADSIIQGLSEKAPRKIMRFADAGALLSGSFNEGSALVWGEPSSLKFTCGWGAPVDGKVSPDFRGTSVYSVNWTPPEGFKVRFVVVASVSGERWEVGNCYLIGVSRTTPGWYRLPLPNTYDDGRVCMGGRVGASPTVAGAWLMAFSHWQSAPFNADLIDRVNAGHCKGLFSYTSSGAQVPCENPVACCVKVNSTVYDSML